MKLRESKGENLPPSLICPARSIEGVSQKVKSVKSVLVFTARSLRLAVYKPLFRGVITGKIQML